MIFLSVSESCVNSISRLIKKDGYVISNGFDNESNLINIKSSNNNSNQLIITYAGTLYEYQKIEIFINTIKKLVNSIKIDLKVYFIGVNVIPKEYLRIKKLIKNYEVYFILKERIPK